MEFATTFPELFLVNLFYVVLAGILYADENGVGPNRASP